MTVVNGRLDKWGKWTREVSFLHNPKALVCRKDNIAVGLDSGDITILDAITGTSRSTLSGHTESVTSLAFSPDGRLLVSGSNDKAIKLWDIQTGGVIKTFRDLSWVKSVSISPNTAIIASGSHSNIRLWDVRTGVCHCSIDTGPAPGRVTGLDFLLTVPGRLMSVSGGLVQQWDTNGRKAGPATSGRHIAFSSDGKRFILCDKGPPTVRDTVAGSLIAILHSPGRDFSHCYFSPNDQLVAGVADKTIYIWNVTDTPRLIETFTPDDSSISSLAYSFSLISMHIDGKIRFRRIDGDSTESTTRNTKSAGSRSAKIIHITLQQAKGSAVSDGLPRATGSAKIIRDVAISVDSAGIIKRWELSTGQPETLLQIPEMKEVGCIRQSRGVLTVVYRDGPSLSDWGVSTWDAKARRKPRRKTAQNRPLGREPLERKPLSGCLTTLGPTLDRDNQGISEDGTTFFVVNAEEIRTWSTLTGEITGTSSHRNYTHATSLFSVHLDGPIVWISSSEEWRAWGWSLKNLDSPPIILPDIPIRPRLAYLRDGCDVRGKTGQSRIIDIDSQTEVFRLPGQFARPGKAAWNGRYLFAVSETGKVLILDFYFMTPQ